MITVNGEDLPWHEGMTVQQVLDAKHYTFRMRAVWVNDTPISREHFGSRIVDDHDRIQVLHMISGG